MLRTGLNPLVDQIKIPVQVEDLKIVDAVKKPLPVGFLESRAGEKKGTILARFVLPNAAIQFIQPGFAV